MSATSAGELATYGGYDDDAATALFAGAGRTSTTVLPGTFVGMCGALQVIEATMDPNAQLILFISDHGDLHKSKSATCGRGTCTSGQIPLGTTLYDQMLAEPFNVPRVTILSPGPTNPGPVLVTVSAAGGNHMSQVDFSNWQSYDANHDDDVLDPGEGLMAVIDIPENLLDSSGVSVTVVGDASLALSEVDLGSGVMPKLKCPSDVTGDGVVNVDDLLMIINGWGPCPSPCAADLTSDGAVDVDDLLAVINTWGLCP